MTSRLFSCLLLPLALALGLAATAHGAVRFGVTEDAGKYADDGGATFFPTLTDLGMTQNRITVFWDAAHPAEIQEKAFLDRSLPVAAANHIRIVFSVQPLHPTDVTSTPGGALAFSSYVALLARAYPQVKQFVIGNEPRLKGYQWPNAGVPNFARIKQAVWDAFAGTAQPTFAEAGWSLAPPAPAAPPLTLFLDETGWQAAILPSERSAYAGRENSK